VHSVPPLDPLDVENRVRLAIFLQAPSTASSVASMRRDDPSALGELLGKRAGFRQLRFKIGNQSRIATVA
jgi:hypothetical protein